MKGYDGVFIMNYLIQNELPTDKYNIIMDGLKINLMAINKVKIIDSLNFIPSALAKFSKTFDISEIKKGYFPHKFNIPENQNYIGPYPAAEYYGYDMMSLKKKRWFFIMVQ